MRANWMRTAGRFRPGGAEPSREASVPRGHGARRVETAFAGFRRGNERAVREASRRHRLPPEPGVSADELERLAHEYRHLHEEHRHARPRGRTRRRLETRLQQLRDRFEHLLAATPPSERDRQRRRARLGLQAAREPRGGKIRSLVAGGVQPTISVRGHVPREARARLAQALTELARVSPEPVLRLSGSLIRDADPANPRPVVAKATIDVNGRNVRAHVAAASAAEAVDLLEARLRRNLRRLAGRVVAGRRDGQAPQPGEWRHGDRPTPRAR